MSGAGLVVAAAAVAACAAPTPVPDDAVPLAAIVAGRQLVGAWDWIHYEIEDGTLRRERERWQFGPTDDPRRLVGTYVRDVLVRALDGVPFACNQRTSYHQRVRTTVRAEVVATGIAITELGYAAEPSPCDPGLRQLGGYVATLQRGRLRLAWPGGDATLTRAAADAPAAATPELPPPPAGRWRWRATSITRAGLVRDEEEDWELAAADDGRLGGTYVRTVRVRSPDGAPLPCAGASSYAWVDRYLVRGAESEDGWRLEETAVLAGQHPCLAVTPDRTLDSATFAPDGDHLIVTWRGKRRQVLAR